jgi:hypothetical protein
VDSASLINQFLLVLRNGGGMQAMLEFACKNLTETFKASRTIVWLVVGDGLRAVESFSIDKEEQLSGLTLSSIESMTIVMAFLSRFPSENGTGVFALPEETSHETIYSNSEVVDKMAFESQILAQLRWRGIFSGFIDIQSDQARVWSDTELKCLQEVSVALSVLVGQIRDASQLAADLCDLKAAQVAGTTITSSQVT